MNVCETCHAPLRGRAKRECPKCREWREYWASLTPEEVLEEQRMMAEYARGEW